MSISLGFVIPVKDEEASLEELTQGVLVSVRKSFPNATVEIILIDDGSTDNSWAVMKAISTHNSGLVKCLRFRKNIGKALALEAGFRICTTDIIFTMDADLQDDPKEIPRFIEKLNEGYDLVSGWKRTRHDPLSKTLPSKLFNGVTARLTGIDLKDFNCGFKCYRADVVKNIRLYGELHRYIPVIAAELGYKIGQIDVEHHPRLHGVSKYGWERYVRGLIDLITVLATTKWLVKPGHLFGGVGVGLGMVSLTSLAYLTLLWIFGNEPIGTRPLLTFGVMTAIASLQMISLGVIAEFFVKSQPFDVDRYISERNDGE